MTDVDAPYAVQVPLTDGPSTYLRAVPRKPYRSPREWLDPAQSGHFGHRAADRLKWREPGTALDEALLSAAKMQNDLVVGIRFAFTYNKATSAVAAFADLHPDTVRDILNGSKHATLSVLYALARGVDLDPAVTLKRVAAPAGVEQPGEPQSALPPSSPDASRE